MQSFNGVVARHNWVGVAITPETRAAGDIGGKDTVLVQFELVDNRPLSKVPLDENKVSEEPFQIPLVSSIESCCADLPVLVCTFFGTSFVDAHEFIKYRMYAGTL